MGRLVMIPSLMTKSNMKPKTCFLWLSLLIFSLPQTPAERNVFQPLHHASSFISRSKRANSFILEEIFKGNLERECYEEICNFEEAREYFEDTPKTFAFWTKYVDGDQCLPNPCHNGAACTDEIGGYKCNCTELYTGKNCEIDVSQCPHDGPLSCDHFCLPAFASYHCSCAAGYQLDTDGRTCWPKGTRVCGRSPGLGNVPHSDEKGASCPHGHCPWQVVLVNDIGEEFCSGVILGPKAVLTTASCLSRPKNVSVVVGDRVIGVSRVSTHEWYTADRSGDDLAFLHLNQSMQFNSDTFQVCLPEKDFSENILMRVGRRGVMGGRPRGRDSLTPSYLPLEMCRSSLNLSFPLTNKMFCTKHHGHAKAGAERGEEHCKLLTGTPIVTIEKNTAFLTGVLTSPQPHHCGQGHAFTKLSRYLPWIQRHLTSK